MSASSDLQTRIDALRRQGRHAEAATLCLEAGDFVRASQLYAAVWRFSEAIGAAERAERYELAFEHALSADDLRARERLIQTLQEHPGQALQAARLAQARDRLPEAARLYEAGGETETAASLYERASEFFEAARCNEALGRYREAGVLYERRVRDAPGDTEAALRLGRIVAQFGRYEHAVRALQRAARDPERAGGALRLMVACFSALGLEWAAARTLDTLRRDDPTLPVTVPEFLRESFGDERGLVGNDEAKQDGPRLLAGRYRVIRPLGAGATGRVMLGHDAFYDRDVAIKLLTVGAGATGRDAYARFAREARVAAGLEHPNVVRIFEYNPEGPFLVMEYMAGGTLEERLGPVEAEGRLAPPTVEAVLRAVVAGLQAVHRRGVVHRDLKPANVFFGPAGEVKIGDFGVAHLADLGATLTGALLGTLAYMAPEQITASRRPDASTDLYAVGVLLFRMLTGRLPFTGPDYVTQHLEQPPPLPSDVSPELGSVYDALVHRLLAKTPQQRPQSAAQVLEAVSELPWHAPAAGEGPAPGGSAEREPSQLPSAPAAPDERYAWMAPLPEGAWKARDALLDRIVRIEPCDERKERHLVRLAQCDSPYLQAVYETDVERGRAVLEQPEGRPLVEQGELHAGRRARAAADIRAAVERLHAEGVTHGQIDARHVVLGPQRAVLLLPEDEVAASPGDDQRALEDLFRG